MYHKWQPYNAWFLKYEAQQTECFVILENEKVSFLRYEAWQTCFLLFWAIFSPFIPLTTPKIRNFEKIEKKQQEISSFFTRVPQIIIICYTVPEIRYVTDVICIFHSGLFLPFYPLTAQKFKIKKKIEKRLEISSFSTCVTKIMITWCTIPEIWYVTDGRIDG